MREQAVVESVGDVLGLIDMFEGSSYIQKGSLGFPPSIFGSTAYNCLYDFSSHPIVAVMAPRPIPKSRSFRPLTYYVRLVENSSTGQSQTLRGHLHHTAYDPT